MKKRKYVYLMFREYENETFARYLEEMAAKGWMITACSRSGFLCFEKTEPGELSVSVTLIPGVSAFQNGETAESLSWRRKWEADGWKLQAETGIWQIYIAGGDGPKAREFKEEDERELLRRQKKISLSAYQLLASVAVPLLLVVPASTIMADPVKNLSDKNLLALPLFVICMAVLLWTPLIRAACWYRKAERQLRAGIHPRQPDIRQVKRARCVELGLFVVMMLLCFSCIDMDPVDRIIWLVETVLLLGTFHLLLLFVRKKERGGERSRIVLYFVGATVVGMLILLPMTHVLRKTLEPYRDQAETYRELFAWPVTLEELGYQPYDYEYFQESQKTWLAGYQSTIGYRTGEDGSEERLVMRYYECPVEWLMKISRNRYPIERGNAWEIEEKKSQRESGVSVTRYRYRYVSETDSGETAGEAAGKSTGKSGADFYVISAPGRMLVLEYNAGAEPEEAELAVERLAGG